MKKATLLTTMVLTIFSCTIEEMIEPPIIDTTFDSECLVEKEISAPPGFEISLIRELEFNGGLNKIQFINQQEGFLLANNNIGGYLNIFKTEDGGVFWTDLEVTNFESPIDLFFLNENEGFVSSHGLQGSLLKTTDGGETWENKVFPNLKGNFYHIQADQSGNIYAMLSGIEINDQLMRSTDKGESWEVFFTHEALNFTQITYSYTVLEDYIFALGEDGKLLKLDLEANLLETLSIQQSTIYDISIIDEDNLVAVSTERVIKTRDGGASWQVIFDGSARLLTFNSPNEGMLLLNKDFCANTVQSIDVIAYTKDGGMTWAESEESSGLSTFFGNAQAQPDGSLILIIGNGIYRISEQ